ncbi:methyl-accepting chemotaxis protein [Gluconacetobacter diazotrophicus]|uniref:Chemoreceptor mcpA n=2 Tax=Gluconacetobacter diazotrophicus TaxID=33996 RepID=A9H610_GLUDA|nr:globin-coupled sensor protein [Gluconacetobacter diazotrophicus]MBB2158467.1 globin-coupled sensor protein [Gluconacetobacter diazotrophicus]CAP54399.1 Chemoreceptor mcpA [Gluconacetobacter diazotrophicus PA1 5]
MTKESQIVERLSFMNLDSTAQQNIKNAKPILMKALPGALDTFYDQARTFPHTAQFFHNANLIASAKNRQLGHWDYISSGEFNQDYVKAVTTIGQTHARIGLEPRWYIGGYALVLESLIAAIVEARWPRGILGAGRSSARQVTAELSAVVKATMLDMDFAISVYLDALETARQASEARARATNDAVMKAVGEALGRIAQGDLTHRIGDDMPEEYRQLRDDFNLAIAQLSETLSQVQGTAETISRGADEIANAADDLSQRTERQAASIQQTAAALDQITASVTRTAGGTKRASGAVNAAKADTRHSGTVVDQAILAMSEIEKSSNQIARINGIIYDIAFQTNLLALNAGVEAARAGDQGRGFAVVAQEVRALAQRSSEAAREIKALILASAQHVNHGVGLVDETGKALKAIMAKVTEIDDLVGEIASSTQEQAAGLSQVNIAVNQVDQVVQQNAAMVEETTAATRSLKGETEELAALVGRFAVDDGQDQSRTMARPDAPASRQAVSQLQALADRISASFARRPRYSDGPREEV